MNSENYQKQSSTIIICSNRNQFTSQESNFNIQQAAQNHISQNSQSQVKKKENQNACTLQQSDNQKQQIQKRRQESKLYLKQLFVLFKQNRLFFFNQIITGNVLKNILYILHLECLASMGTGFIHKIIAAYLNFMTIQCLPICLRPFFAGFFFPLLLLYFTSFKYLTVKVIQNSHYKLYQQLALLISYGISIILMIIVAFKGSGTLNNQKIRKLSQEVIQNNKKDKKIGDYCFDCKIIKSYRSVHCPICKQCIPKFTKHSLFLNQCIGAGNQLLFMILMLSIIMCEGVSLSIFLIPREHKSNSYFITKMAFYLVNNYFQMLATTEFFSIFINNLIYNCTEHQIKFWKTKQYLKNQNQNQFYNHFDKNFCHNLKQSVYSMLDIQQLSNSSDLQFKQIINWKKKLIYDIQYLKIQNNKNNTIDTIQLKECKNKQIQNQEIPQTQKQLYSLDQKKNIDNMILKNDTIEVGNYKTFKQDNYKFQQIVNQ